MAAAGLGAVILCGAPLAGRLAGVALMAFAVALRSNLPGGERRGTPGAQTPYERRRQKTTTTATRVNDLHQLHKRSATASRPPHVRLGQMCARSRFT
jgi:hypothetical protein